jgi:lipoate---protein ligase
MFLTRRLHNPDVLAQEKIPGGKLVCVEVEADGATVARLRITGDFFLHPEEAIGRLEGSLSGIRLEISEAEAESILAQALGDAQLIGVSCHDLARLFRKAVG